MSEQLRAKPFLLEPELLNYQLLDYQEAHNRHLAGLEESVQRAFSRALEQAGLRGIQGAMEPAGTDRQLEKTLNSIVEELAGLNGGLALLSATQEKLHDWITAKQPAQTVSPQAETDPVVLTQLLAETQTVLTSFNGAQENQVRTVESIREAATEMRALVQSTRRTAADLVQNHRIMMGHIKKLEEHWEYYREQLDRMQQTLETTLTGFKDDLGQALRGVHGEIDGLLARSLEHFSGALGRFQETLDSLSVLARLEQDREEGRKTSLFGKKK